jgi:hypothetical protein
MSEGPDAENGIPVTLGEIERAAESLLDLDEYVVLLLRWSVARIKELEANRMKNEDHDSVPINKADFLIAVIDDKDSCYRKSVEKGLCVKKQAFCPIRDICKFGGKNQMGGNR